MLPLFLLPQLSRGIRLQRIDCQFGSHIGREHSMNMIRPDIQSTKQPLAHVAGMTNRLCHRFALLRIEDDRGVFKAMVVLLLPCSIGPKVRSAVLIVKTIDRSTLVAMQPGAIGTKRNQVRQGNVAAHRAQYTEPPAPGSPMSVAVARVA